MASSDKKRKTKQVWKPGDGWSRAIRAKHNLMRAEMKLKRWERYNEEITQGKRPVPLFKHGKKKGQPSDRFDTDGLQNYIQVQKDIIKMGRFVYED